MPPATTGELTPVKEFSRIAAANNPTRTAFGNGLDGRRLTWPEFEDESVRAANGLRAHVGQGDRVAFLCGQSLEHAVLFNGALKAGCVVSNLHTRAAPATVESCVDALRPRVLVVDEDTADFYRERVRGRLSADVGTVVTTGEPEHGERSLDALTADAGTDPPDVRTGEDDIVAVMWTSGTTGDPKGWCHTNRSLFMRAMGLSRSLEVDRPTRQPNVFTPSFAAWYSVLLPAMLSGATTFFLEAWDPERYLRAIDDLSLTTGLLVPTMWRAILRLDALEDYDTSSLASVTSAGERLDAATLDGLRDHLCPTVKNMYAATEAIVAVITDAELDEARVESVGKPVQGVEARVVDPDGSVDDAVPTGEVGEVVVRAPDAPVWAWGETETAAASFEDGWWRTGDLGHRDADGFLYLEGRTDLMILSKGVKVYPGPVEDRLNAHPGVREAAVVGVEDEEYGERVTAIVDRSDPEVTADDLDEWCLESDELARIERPRTYRFVEGPLPRTASGKLDRLAAKGALD
ncbi:MAG: class I adenylate-forming enzyme family protein [Halobacteriales archaeon]